MSGFTAIPKGMQALPTGLQEVQDLAIGHGEDVPRPHYQRRRRRGPRMLRLLRALAESGGLSDYRAGLAVYGDNQHAAANIIQHALNDGLARFDADDKYRITALGRELLQRHIPVGRSGHGDKAES